MFKTTQYSAAVLMAFAVVIMPEMLLAGDLGTVGGDLCDNVVGALTGTIGQAIATLAIIFLGIGAFFGKINWGLAVMTGAGIIAIFGAAAVVNSISTDGGCA